MTGKSEPQGKALHVLKCQHGEVIALFGIAYEVGNSLSHLFNECVWFWRCGLQHIFNPFLAKHLVSGIFGLVQTIGIEEDGGTWCECCLLLRKRPVRHRSYRQIMIDIDH